MENFGTIFPTLIIGETSKEAYLITTIFQIIIFLLFIIEVVKIIKLYLKNSDLKQNAEENKEQIKLNNEKIKKIISRIMKIGGIIFAILILSQIILSNFV